VSAFLTEQRQEDASRGSLYTEMLQRAADTALAPARKLVDASRGRQIASSLTSDVNDVLALYRDVAAERARIEADRRTRPDVLRQQWSDLTAEIPSRGDGLSRAITTHSAELREALAAEALPTSSDPSAVLVARGDVEAAIRAAGTNQRSLFFTMTALAQRGGDVSAAVASDWGRAVYASASGDEAEFDLIRAEAIKTSINGADETRRRAAVALQALDQPAPGDRAGSLYSIAVMANAVIEDSTRMAQEGPVIG
jgi:hypothetical protein